MEAYPLNSELRVITFQDLDSLELFGVTNEVGRLLIKPEYDEFDILPNGLVTAFHGAHYDEYDGDANQLYGRKVFNECFELISNSSLKDYEVDDYKSLTLYFKNGETVYTDWDGNIIDKI